MKKENSENKKNKLNKFKDYLMGASIIGALFTATIGSVIAYKNGKEIGAKRAELEKEYKRIVDDHIEKQAGIAGNFLKYMFLKIEMDWRHSGAFLNTPLEELALAKRVDYEPVDKKGFQNLEYVSSLKPNPERANSIAGRINEENRKLIFIEDYNKDGLRDILYSIGKEKFIKYGLADGGFSPAEKIIKEKGE